MFARVHAEVWGGNASVIIMIIRFFRPLSAFVLFVLLVLFGFCNLLWKYLSAWRPLTHQANHLFSFYPLYIFFYGRKSTIRKLICILCFFSAAVSFPPFDFLFYPNFLVVVILPFSYCFPAWFLIFLTLLWIHWFLLFVSCIHSIDGFPSNSRFLPVFVCTLLSASSSGLMVGCSELNKQNKEM